MSVRVDAFEAEESGAVTCCSIRERKGSLLLTAPAPWTGNSAGSGLPLAACDGLEAACDGSEAALTCAEATCAASEAPCDASEARDGNRSFSHWPYQNQPPPYRARSVCYM
eukprot:1393176-Rhodomonas_salina.1